MENVQSIDDIDSVTNLMQSSEFHDYIREIKERVGENPKVEKFTSLSFAFLLHYFFEVFSFFLLPSILPT